MALVRKALSTESVEEARTCALTAVTILIKHKLAIVDPNDTVPFGRTSPGVKKAAAVRRRGEPTVVPPSKTSFATTCLYCGEPLPAGTRVFWSPAFQLAVCGWCYEKEILGRVDSGGY